MVGNNTLKFNSTQILASLQTKVPAHPTSTRHCRRPEMPSLPGLSHAFKIIFSYFRVLEGVQIDKREVKAGPRQAGGPVRAAAVKCGMHCGPYCLVQNIHVRHY